VETTINSCHTGKTAYFKSVIFNLGFTPPRGVVNHFWMGRE